jgi:hypothetical protein
MYYVEVSIELYSEEGMHIEYDGIVRILYDGIVSGNRHK